jgi:hypothetical protein
VGHIEGNLRTLHLFEQIFQVAELKVHVANSVLSRDSVFLMSNIGKVALQAKTARLRNDANGTPCFL